jgi:hypothetical protein
MVMPPAGNRASKLVDFEPLPVVLVPDCFPVAVALPVVDLSSLFLLLLLLLLSPLCVASLLSPVCVAVGFSEVFAGCVLDGASEDLSESITLRQFLSWAHSASSDLLSSCRPNSIFLTSATPCMLSKASDMACVTDDMATTAARI